MKIITRAREIEDSRFTDGLRSSSTSSLKNIDLTSLFKSFAVFIYQAYFDYLEIGFLWNCDFVLFCILLTKTIQYLVSTGGRHQIHLLASINIVSRPLKFSISTHFILNLLLFLNYIHN